MIKIIKLDNGKPIMAFCPEHGEVEIISLPTEGSGSLKRISRAKAAQSKVNYGNSPKSGELSCGCKFNEYDNTLSKQFNIVCRLIELANDISFENRYELKTDNNHDDFAMRMFNIFKAKVVDAGYCNEIRLNDFTGEEYTSILNEFEGIEKYLHNGTNYSLSSKDNIVVQYYAQPEKQEMPQEYTWGAFFNIKPDGSEEVANYLIKWCRYNDITVQLTGDENPQEIADRCVKAMYGEVEL